MARGHSNEPKRKILAPLPINAPVKRQKKINEFFNTDKNDVNDVEHSCVVTSKPSAVNGGNHTGYESEDWSEYENDNDDDQDDQDDDNDEEEEEEDNEDDEDNVSMEDEDVEDAGLDCEDDDEDGDVDERLSEGSGHFKPIERPLPGDTTPAAILWIRTHAMITKYQETARSDNADDVMSRSVIKVLKGKVDIDRITGYVMAGFNLQVRNILGKQAFDEDDVALLKEFDSMTSLPAKHKSFQHFAVYLHVLKDIDTHKVSALYAGQTCDKSGFRSRPSKHVRTKMLGREVVEDRIEKANNISAIKTAEDRQWRPVQKLTYHYDVLLETEITSDMRIAAMFPMEAKFRVIVTLAEELLVCLFDLFDTVTDCPFAQARQQISQSSGISIKGHKDYRGLNRELPVFGYSGNWRSKKHGPCMNCGAKHSPNWLRSRINHVDIWCNACYKHHQKHQRLRVVGELLTYVFGRAGPCRNCGTTTTSGDRWWGSQLDNNKNWCGACYMYYRAFKRIRVVANLARVGPREGPCNNCRRTTQKTAFRPCLTDRSVDWCDTCWSYYRRTGRMRVSF